MCGPCPRQNPSSITGVSGRREAAAAAAAVSMSRREGRDSLGKRLHARPDGDPSPKRSKDDRTVSERAYSSRSDLTGVKQGRQTKWDQKHAENLQDGLTIVPSPALEKTHAGSISKKVDKADPLVGATHSSPQTDEPRSRSYFQHDERGIAGQGGRSFGHRASERGWRYRPDPKERSNDKVEGSLLPGSDPPERDEKFSDEQKRDKIHHGRDGGGTNNTVARRDEHHEPEAAAAPVPRRRPAFRENKLPAKEPPEEAPAAAEAAAAEFAREERRPARREERSYPRGQGRPERTFAGVDNRSGRGGDRPAWRGEVHRAAYHQQPRERFGSSGGPGRGGREKYQERNQSYHPPAGNLVEKWKHDLFDEANRSPTPKNEEDQIAKIEALLAS